MNKITPIGGCRQVYIGEYGLSNGNAVEDLLGLFSEMGYFLYYDPTGESHIIVSDKKMTFGEYKKIFIEDPEWWDNETSFNEQLNEELDLVYLE